MHAGFVLPMLHPYSINESSAAAAIEAGFDSLWLPDHLLGVYPPAIWSQLAPSQMIPDADAWLDPFCVASTLSQQFDVPLGTAVTDSVRRRAIDVARAALTIHHENRRGFIIGIGSGEAESTLPFGYDFDKPVGRLEEFLKEITTLFATGNMPSGPGRTGIPLTTDAGRPQIWLAAHGPRMLRMAGEYADGWLPIGLQPAQYGEALATIEKHAKAAGRETPTASQVVIIVLSSSREKLIEQIEQQPLAKMLTLFAPGSLWNEYDIEHPAGRDCRGMADVIPHTIDPDKLTEALANVPIEMFEKYVLLGSAQDVAEKINDWANAGMEHVVIADSSGLVGSSEEALESMRQLNQIPGLIEAY